jgi:hypothetical protein
MSRDSYELDLLKDTYHERGAGRNVRQSWML